MPVQSAIEEGLRKCKKKWESLFLGVALRNHPVNSLNDFFNTTKQPNEIKPSPIKSNKPIPHPIKNHLVLSEFHTITILETQKKIPLTNNHPISPFLQSHFFLDLDKRKKWLTRKNNPQPLEPYSSLVVPKSIVVSGSPNRWQGIYNHPIGIIYHLYLANWVII